MVPARAETSKAASYFIGRRFHGGISRVTQYADAAIYGNRTCGPAILSIPAEPAVRVLVVDVSRIEEGHQDIHVEKCDTHASSRKPFTIWRSGFGAPALGTKSRTPLRSFTGATVARDCRASCEMTSPSVTPLCRANCLAVATKSSSSSTVVRIVAV